MFIQVFKAAPPLSQFCATAASWESSNIITQFVFMAGQLGKNIALVEKE